MQQTNLNIVIVGKIGVGKSSFTAGLKAHNSTSPKNFGHARYTTQDITSDTADALAQRLIKEQDDAEHIPNHIHTLYYCFPADDPHIDSFEQRFIERIQKNIHVVIVLTKSEILSQEQLSARYTALEQRFGKSMPIVHGHNSASNILAHSVIGLWKVYTKHLLHDFYHNILFPGKDKINVDNRKLERLWRIHCNSSNSADDSSEQLVISLYDFLRLSEFYHAHLRSLNNDKRSMLITLLTSGNQMLKSLENLPDKIKLFQHSMTKQADAILALFSEASGMTVELPFPAEAKAKVADLEDLPIKALRKEIEKIIPALWARIPVIHIVAKPTSMINEFQSWLTEKRLIAEFEKKTLPKLNRLYQVLRDSAIAYNIIYSTECYQIEQLMLKKIFTQTSLDRIPS